MKENLPYPIFTQRAGSEPVAKKLPEFLRHSCPAEGGVNTDFALRLTRNLAWQAAIRFVVLPKSWTVKGAILINARNPKRTRRRYTAKFKAEVAQAALIERRPLAKLAARYQLAPARIRRWRLPLRQQMAQVFVEAIAPVATPPDVKPLYAAIGRWQIENALLKKQV